MLLLLSSRGTSQTDTTKIRISVKAALGAITDIERGDACKEREVLLKSKITLLESISEQQKGIINEQAGTINRNSLQMANHSRIEQDLQKMLRKEIRIGRIKTVAGVALPILAILAYSKLN